MIALFTVYATLNVKRGQDQTERDHRELDVNTGFRLIIAICYLKWLRRSGESSGKLSEDHCLILGAPAPQLVVVWPRDVFHPWNQNVCCDGRLLKAMHHFRSFHHPCERVKRFITACRYKSYLKVFHCTESGRFFKWNASF